MVSSSTPFSIKNYFKGSNPARTSNVSLNSEPTPSSSGSNRRPPSISTSSHHNKSSSHQSLYNYSTNQQQQQQQQQQVYPSSQSEPPLLNRPLPPSPTQARSSSRPSVSKHNKRKETTSTPFFNLKRFSLAPNSMDEEIKQDYTAYTSIMDTTSASNESATSSHHHHNQRASVIGGGGGGASNAHQHHQQKHKQQKPPKQQPVTIQQTALPPMPPTHSKADSASEHSGSSGNNNSSSSSVGGDSTTQLSSKNPKEYHQQLQHRPRQQDVPSKEMQQRQRQQEKHEAPSQMIPKSAVKNHRMKKLLDENEELKKSKAHDVQEYERRCSKLQHSLDAKEAELSRLSVNFHNHVKTIRATDDDFSTIQVKLTTLQSKITALPLTLKKYAVDKAVMTRYFIQCWPDLTAAIEQLAKKKGALDYNVICLFVEKLVTEELVANIYRTPIMIGLPTNEAYMQISEYMATHDKDWALRLRQQMCKLAVKSLTSNNDPSAKPIATAKKQVVDRIVAKLANIYTTESHEAIISKVGKFVDLACELSVAMHSQDIPVDAAELVEGKDIFKDELVMPQNGSVDNATVIRVVICPPFTANEKQMNDVVLMKGKVICL